ncbi:MAG: hypothetical protein ACE5JA_07475, partial [bacterium]
MVSSMVVLVVAALIAVPSVRSVSGPDYGVRQKEIGVVWGGPGFGSRHDNVYIGTYNITGNDFNMVLWPKTLISDERVLDPMRAMLDASGNDFDGDGRDEIVMSWKAEEYGTQGLQKIRLKVYDMLPNFALIPKGEAEREGGYLFTSISVATGNLDGVSQPEVVLFYSRTDPLEYVLCVYRVEGNLNLNLIAETTVDPVPGTRYFCDVACGDFDGDVDDEIAVSYLAWPFRPDIVAKIYDFDASQLVEKSSFSTPPGDADQSESAIACGDFDDDGNEELILGWGYYPLLQNYGRLRIQVLDVDPVNLEILPKGYLVIQRLREDAVNFLDLASFTLPSESGANVVVFFKGWNYKLITQSYNVTPDLELQAKDLWVDEKSGEIPRLGADDFGGDPMGDEVVECWNDPDDILHIKLYDLDENLILHGMDQKADEITYNWLSVFSLYNDDPPEPPAKPLLRAWPEGNHVHLEWSCEQGSYPVDHYEIWRRIEELWVCLESCWWTDVVYDDYEVNPNENGATYYVKAVDDHGLTSPNSNFCSVGPGGGADPVVDGPCTAEATAYNNARHVIVGDNDRIHMCYWKTQTTDVVCYSYSDDTLASVADPELVSTGRFPAVGLTDDGQPVLCWADNSETANKQLLYSVRSELGSWSDPTALVSEPVAEISAPSFIVVDGDTGVVAWTEHGEPDVWVVKHGLFRVGEGLDIASTLDSFTTDMNSQLVSIAVDMNGVRHIAWDADGAINYTSVSDIPPSVSGVISREGRVSVHPSISAYGDRLFACWTEESQTGSTSTVVHSARELQGAWSDPESLSLSAGTSHYPQSFGPLIMWFGKLGADNYNVCAYSSLEFGERFFSYNMTGSVDDSKFPSLFVDQADTVTHFYYLWHEDLEDEPVKILSYNPSSPLPYYSATLGLDYPSPYTDERQGVMRWGDASYESADFAHNILVYSFSNLTSSKRYDVGLTF